MSANVIMSLILMISLLVGGAYAFIAPEGSAMYKTSMFLGYDVTGIVFDTNEAQPEIVDTITFRIAPSHGSTKAGHVEIQTKPGGPWTECSLVDDVLPARVATCAFTSLSVEDVTDLEIVAE